MKGIIRFITRTYITIGLFFYFTKIKSSGKENIPKKGAVLFVSNHQNGLLDPLLIITNIWWRRMNVLTRAGVFKKGIINYLFSCFRMLPIYRVRDGWNTLSKNEAIFNKCHDLLNNNEQLLIFPEGNHNIKRRIRPVSKGFTRILIGAYKKYPSLNVIIIPIGLNYSRITSYPSSIHIKYGKAINAKDLFVEGDDFKTTNNIKKAVRTALKKLSTHIPGDEATYEKIEKELFTSKNDFLNPEKTNQRISALDLNKIATNTIKTSKAKNPFYYLVILNSIIPWLIWNKLKKGIKEPEFKSTFRWALGISLYPIFYILQTIIIGLIYSPEIGYCYFGGSLLIAFLTTKLDVR